MESFGIITPGSKHLLFRDAHSHLRLAIGYAGLRRFVAINHGDIDIFYLYTELRSAKTEKSSQGDHLSQPVEVSSSMLDFC